MKRMRKVFIIIKNNVILIKIELAQLVKSNFGLLYEKTNTRSQLIWDEGKKYKLKY